MKQERATNIEIALHVISGMRDALWHDGRRWWYRSGGQWLPGTALIHDRIAAATLPDGPYWERAASRLRSPDGRRLLLRLMYRMLQAPVDFPGYVEPAEWRFRPPFLITEAS